MGIIIKSDENIRKDVIQFLARKHKDNPQFKVIDVGGFGNQWCDEYVDTYVDMTPMNTQKRFLQGDINDPIIWQIIGDETWDFSICTHVLEDIRRPEFVIANLLKISRAGFIAVPNKHTELTSIESPFYVGYCHHRWIFTIVEDKLRIMFKFPIANYHSRFNMIWRWFSGVPLLTKIQWRLGIKPGGGSLRWLNHKKITTKTRPFELGFLWVNDFEFEFINNDFAGMNFIELDNLFRQDLSQGL